MQSCIRHHIVFTGISHRIFWHESGVFYNHSRSLDEYLDPAADIVMTSAHDFCNSGDPFPDLDHFLIQNTVGASRTLKSSYLLWNHTTCKYGPNQNYGGASLCSVVDSKASYAHGFKGALMSVLSHCDECAGRVKYTNFRAFNSKFPCYGDGDLLVTFPAANSTAVIKEFLGNSDISHGTRRDPELDPSNECSRPRENVCSTREQCDLIYASLNKNRGCATRKSA